MISAGSQRSPRHVAVCVITYRRQELLKGTLASIAAQTGLGDGVTFKIVVVDNDAAGSARTSVDAFRRSSDVPITYVVEEQPGIPFARNRALDEALPNADLIVFIDDDEVAEDGWLAAFLRAATQREASVFAGPVLPLFPTDHTPRWARGSGLFGAPQRPDGAELPEAFTGNLALRRHVLHGVSDWFDTSMAHTGGTDVEFTARVAAAGFSIEWVADAIVCEHVPPQRLRLRWIARRGFRIGNNRLFRLRTSHRNSAARRLALAMGACAEAVVALGMILIGAAVPPYFARGVSRLFRAAGTLTSYIGQRFEEYSR